MDGRLEVKVLGPAHPSELAFILEPSDMIAVRDRPLVLHCQVEGEAPISITWYHNGVALSNDSRTALLANGSLRLESIQRPPRGGNPSQDPSNSSAGEFSCAAQNCYGLLVSRKARIQIATLSKFHMHPESMSVEEGGVARFQCFVQGVPEATITWEHNQTALMTDDYRFTLLPTGILQITGVRRSDVGTYRCVARNIANTRYSQEATLSISGEQVSVPKVFKEPVILSGPQNLTITVHQTAILECIATGNPRPIVSWSRLDGRSIGVEGIQVLGTGNLMISDVSVKHAGVYVCAANRPGTRVRRTAQGILMVQAPPEFVQWPQSLSKTPGTSAIFTCVAQGVPEPHLIWLKNGKVLAPGENIKLTHNNSTLMIQAITSADEAIYQCIAENSAGTNQASARLAVALSKDLPSSPEGVEATALSTTSIRVSWLEPSRDVTEAIIGYVLHIRKAGVPAAVGFFTKILNVSTIQVFLELPLKPGGIEGFKLYLRKLPSAHYEGPQILPGTANSFIYSNLEPAATYEIKLQAFNGNGDGNSSVRFVSLQENSERLDANSVCQCRQDGDASLAGIVVGVHIGMACIIFCVLFLMFGYRKSLFCKKGAQENWTVPQGTELVPTGSQDPPLTPRKPESRAKPPEMVELVSRNSSSSDGHTTRDGPHFEVTVERCLPSQPSG
ncbi:immunoglobulin superfamily DCC subclass member 3-like [Python bivittatus]|uniref:immunoglobulin superfamily DCC subclass member 3-like n=1 Tax=Python bivittatus TaxID=176946 RepID=UPI000441D068|nr:immunoglobulin superfamily DCC subclass member 3-like [Python bivittatus]